MKDPASRTNRILFLEEIFRAEDAAINSHGTSTLSLVAAPRGDRRRTIVAT